MAKTARDIRSEELETYRGRMGDVHKIIKIVSRQEAQKRKVLTSDGEDVSTPELVRRIAYALGRPARLVPVPEGLMRLGGRMIGKVEQVKRLCGSLEIDSSKVRRVLGWKPVCMMEEELGRVAEWYRSTDYAD